ncbi:hypothetical protein [Geomicrobium sp. JCM 19039]|uniref:hypothetical protein n=1 Tax=Geomicrobium sp. JCM 19039 TaxID=1460636 RepID=UPI00045F4A44|nr:hypothetical protein [Geomicrobium sp. JCM 19039]GAK12926.1 hypothetical protein JCM19039_2733 [Geomicrobium sp. JCM 19039]
MRRYVSFLMLLCLLFAGSFVEEAHADELMESFSLRVTIETKDNVYQWKYDNPDYYEFQDGDHVLRAEDAKVHVDNMSEQLHVDERVTSDQLAGRIKELFPKLKSMDVRWRNKDSELYTWRWKNDQVLVD